MDWNQYFCLFEIQQQGVDFRWSFKSRMQGKYGSEVLNFWHIPVNSSNQHQAKNQEQLFTRLYGLPWEDDDCFFKEHVGFFLIPADLCVSQK